MFRSTPPRGGLPIQRVQHLCLNVIALRHDRHPPPHLLAPGQRQRLLAAAQQELIRLEVKLALNVISKILCFVPRICLKLILPVAGRRHDRRQALDALGMFDGDNLRDHAAHRRADDMGLAERRLPKSPITSGPGNGILWAETGGRFQARNARERSEFGSQTALRLTNRPELRRFLQTRKPRRFGGTPWWRTQSSRTSLRRPKFSIMPTPLQLMFSWGSKTAAFCAFHSA